MTRRADLSLQDFRALSEFRYHIRRFLRFSEDVARDAGVEPQHYLLLLAVKGLPDGKRARVGEIAERMQLQHHSTVELADRLARHGLIQRRRGSQDRREVYLELTPRGEKILQQVARRNRRQLAAAVQDLVTALRQVARGDSGHVRSRPRTPSPGRPSL